ncbi:restriction endonuclease subunit S [Necropsobacter rosorum]|uniref:restriction endonuclease subunit S n=1 Tax=Necropsobacter rosorum TaxID=908285 RepID=UPI003C7BFA0B
MKNNRTFLDKLLDGAEVKWEPLGNIADYEQPTKYLVNSTVYSDHFPTPVLTAGKTFILGYTDEKEGIYLASKSPVIIFDDFTTANKWVDFDFKAKSSAMKMITSKDENIALLKYIYYWLNTLPNNQVDGDHKRQWISNYTNKLIPIPPLPVQTEIVRILDALTALTSELTSELILRRKQYQYYRDKLLSEEELGKAGFEWESLDSISEYSKARIKAKNLNENNYVGVDNLLQNKAGKTKSNYVPTEGNLTEYLPNDILIGNIRPYLKKIWQADCTGGTNGDVLVIHPTSSMINPRYLYHILADDRFFEYNTQHAKGAKMPRGSKSAILQYRFPLPTNPKEQHRIASILDKFETLTNSITEGLPLAIEQSQKRYEYYRELLLNFPG